MNVTPAPNPSLNLNLNTENKPFDSFSELCLNKKKINNKYSNNKN